MTSTVKPESDTELDEIAYKSLFDSMLNGLAYCQMLYVDGEPIDFVYLSVNPAFEQQTGLLNVIGKRASDLIPGILETDADLIDLYGRVATSGKPEIFEHYVIGLKMWFAVSVYSPKPDYFVAIFDVITERKQAEEKLKAALTEADRFRMALDRVPAYIYMKDKQHHYTYANRLTLELFGCNETELMGSSDDRFFPPSTVKQLYDVDERVLSGNNTSEEIEVIDVANRRRIYWEVKTPLYEDSTNKIVGGLLGISTDISEHKELEAKLEHLAHTDHLTELPNRTHFFEQAGKEFARATRYHTPLSIAMLDLDNFKLINDTYGHEIGDRVLKEFANVCIKTLRESDFVGRIGGEEFAILFLETDLNKATEIAERLRIAIANARLPMERGLSVQFTASLGVASLVDMDANIDVFLSRADSALYEAKRNGRNRICTANKHE